MKRGISFALQAAGMVFVCLVTTLKQPVYASGAVTAEYDTAYYYNEQGVELYCDPDGTGSFVIRTCKRKKEIYYDWDKVRESIKDSFDVIKVRCISFKKAKKVEALICNGHVNDAFVKRNIVQIIGLNTLREIWMKIPDSGKNADSTTDRREYGGTINYDKTLTFNIGKSNDPCDGGVSVDIDIIGLGYYHSHPSGEKNDGNCYFIQGPSKQDVNEIKKPEDIADEKKRGIKKMGYVFGMNKRSHLIYIYDKHGLQATIPFSSLLYNTVNK
jgi:hypothetical protein